MKIRASTGNVPTRSSTSPRNSASPGPPSTGTSPNHEQWVLQVTAEPRHVHGARRRSRRATEVALRSLLTPAERDQILAMPTGTEDLAASYTLSDADMSLIRQRRGNADRLGFAVQLALLRHPGITLAEDTQVPPELGCWLASRLAKGLPAGKEDRAAWRQRHRTGLRPSPDHGEPADLRHAQRPPLR
ncbi:MAG: DUF4158 domain-containing protein [Arthrobacter oryzae]